MKNTATIILNRNLPETTNKLVEFLSEKGHSDSDFFVIEAGSDSDKLSTYCTWWETSEDVITNGLRAPRGFNYGLFKLYSEGLFEKYKYFFLITNDTEFSDKNAIKILSNEMDEHPRLGILSPCSKRWGEKIYLNNYETKYFWHIHNTAYFLRREFIEQIMETDDPTYMNFLYDGSNFRGYGADTEIIIKGYANDWASAITSQVWAEENESYLQDRSDLIKTEPFEVNIQEYVEEGRRWMKRKYGFNNRWIMQMYAKFMYDKFFDFHPEYQRYKI